MNPIKFYKNSTTGNWILGSLRKVPACQFTMSYSTESELITLWNGQFAVTGLVTQFIKEDGNPYSDLAEFDLATAGFFSKSIKTSELSPLFEGTKASLSEEDYLLIWDDDTEEFNKISLNDLKTVILGDLGAILESI